MPAAAISWLQFYEDLVGLTEVKQAQDKVIQGEERFLEAQTTRRQQQQAVTDVQSQLQDINKQLERLQRGDERYLQLVRSELEVLRMRDAAAERLVTVEKVEKEAFAALSSAVRESHEKERARAERTKYWSVIGSVVGAVIGITGTTVNNYLRMKELRGLVTEASAGGLQMQRLMGQVSEMVQEQQDQFGSFLERLDVSEPGQAAAARSAARDSQQGALLQQLHSHSQALATEVRSLKAMLAAPGRAEHSHITHTAPEVNLQELFRETEQNVERKIKYNSLWTVTFIYGAFALTLPVLYHIFQS